MSSVPLLFASCSHRKAISRIFSTIAFFCSLAEFQRLNASALVIFSIFDKSLYYSIICKNTLLYLFLIIFLFF